MTHPSAIVTSLSLLLTLPGWSAADGATPLMRHAYPTRALLADFHRARPLSFEELAQGVPEGVDLIVWACHSRSLPPECNDPRVVANLRRFLEAGGGVFLSGFAAAWVHSLGLEPEPPGRMDHYRTGYGDQTPLRGSFEVGLRMVEPSPLAEGLSPDAERSEVFFLASCHSLNMENALWLPGQERRGRPVAYYARRDYAGAFLSPDSHVILTEWRLGRGKLLAYGNNLFLEDFWFNAAESNLHRFLANAARQLTGKEQPAVAALPETPTRLEHDDYMSPPAFAAVQPHSLARRFPGLPYIAHWGWHGQITYQRGGKESVGLDYYRERLIDEPYRWGANLLEFYPPGTHDGLGYPFEWGEDDPIPPPRPPLRYWGSGWDPKWSLENARRLFRMAHERDMLAQVFFHPNPVTVRERGAEVPEAERRAAFLDFAEFQARELQNALAHGWQEAHDGVGSEWWPSDDANRYMDHIWLYNPGSYRYSTAVLDKTGPYYAGTWMCAFGRTAGINACGYGDLWRYVYHPPLYLSYQADCRSMKPSSREWGGWANYGGGSTPDWLLRQVNDFCRDRLYLTSALWWLGEPASTLREEDRAYVYGISMDPLRCAVASTLRAVGSDGYRAKAMRTVEGIPPQYACDEPYPQDTAFIQNNYFRLLRMAGEDRGILQYDPLRLAYYHATGRPDPARFLSPSLLSAEAPDRPRIESPAARVAVEVGEINGSSAEFKGPGGYEKRYACAAEAGTLPAELCYERWPDFPQEVEMSFSAPAGRYDLEIHTLPVEYVCTMEVEVDGRPMGVYFPTPGEATLHRLPFSLASSGEHRLLLRVQKAELSANRRDGRPGLAHALDALVIRPTASQCVVHSIPVKAGHAAVLEERVFLDPDAEYRQTRRYHVINDSPLLQVEIENRAPRPTGWETRMSLPEYGELTPVAGAQRAWRLEGRAGLPALLLAVAGDGAEKVERRGEDVVITSPKQAESSFSLGFLVDDGLYTAAQLPEVERALFAPTPKLALSGDRAAFTNPLSIPRVALVRLARPAGGPYLVRETNAEGLSAWLVRGAQPDAEDDLLKLYLQPRGEVEILPYGFIDGVVKPGFGCQYVLAILDGVSPGRCEVEVVKTGPFLFAPRIEWKQPFDTVKVNGQPWRYFDGSLVFLPNRPGRYVVEVEASGRAAPALTRTFADVAAAVWNEAEKTLELTTRAPHWWEGPLPGDSAYVAHVATMGRQVLEIEGGTLVSWDELRAGEAERKAMAERGVVIRLRPGATRIRFR